jgi:hypothetical protein
MTVSRSLVEAVGRRVRTTGLLLSAVMARPPFPCAGGPSLTVGAQRLREEQQPATAGRQLTTPPIQPRPLLCSSTVSRKISMPACHSWAGIAGDPLALNSKDELRFFVCTENAQTSLVGLNQNDLASRNARYVGSSGDCSDRPCILDTPFVA